MRLFQVPVLIAIRNPFRFRNPYAKGLAVHIFKHAARRWLSTLPTLRVGDGSPSPWLSLLGLSGLSATAQHLPGSTYAR